MKLSDDLSRMQTDMSRLARELHWKAMIDWKPAVSGISLLCTSDVQACRFAKVMDVLERKGVAT